MSKTKVHCLLRTTQTKYDWNAARNWLLLPSLLYGTFSYFRVLTRRLFSVSAGSYRINKQYTHAFAI